MYSKYSLNIGYSNNADEGMLEVIPVKGSSFSVPFGSFYYYVTAYNPDLDSVVLLESSNFILDSEGYEVVATFSDGDLSFFVTSLGCVTYSFTNVSSNCSLELVYNDSFFNGEFLDFSDGSGGDLSSVLNGITALQNQISSLSFPDVDLTPVLTKLDNLDYPQIDINSFSFNSLNGSCGSFADGTIVNCVGIDGDFVVAGSQFVWNDSTTQSSMILYKLVKDEKFCLVPAVYVTVKAS